MGNIYYSERELENAYIRAGVTSGRIVYVTGDLGRLGVIRNKSKQEIIEAHFQIIMTLLGGKGTLVVPTHSFSLCNTDVPFSMTSTQSETGPLTEFVRTRRGAVRQFHAFSSRAAVGHDAQLICGDCSSHAYGYETPFQRMIDGDAIFLSIGMPVASSVSLVHQAEFLMGVPYRYTKEFEHPVVENGVTVPALFYLYVTYLGVDVSRDRNRRILQHFCQYYALQECRIGLSGLQSFPMKEFIHATTRLMRSDIYAWLSRPPANRPYRN